MKKNKKDLKNEQDSRMIKREKIKRLVLKLKVKEIENPDNKLCLIFHSLHHSPNHTISHLFSFKSFHNDHEEFLLFTSFSS
jgi:hypothetical protein